MEKNDTWLTERFEADRAHLQAVAYRLLGSTSEADDAVQEAWLRLSRADTSTVENLSGWLTTVVARVCLDQLRQGRARREEPLAQDDAVLPAAADPEHEALLAESVGLAMQAVLQRLAPAERVAFVLHDVFGLSFAEIASIVDRSPVATRQLASRGRRRVQGATAEDSAADLARHQEIVTAFFRASRTGDLQALLAVLDPAVALRADEAALQLGARTGWLTTDLHGPVAVAEQFNGRAQAAQLALIAGAPGAVWATGRTPRVAFTFTIQHDRIVEIALIADPDHLRQLQIELLP